MNAPVNIGAFRQAAERGPAPRLVRYAVESDAAAAAAARTFTFILSDSSIDRYLDTIAVSGWVLDNYRKNAVVLFGHDASSIENVIGSAKNVRISGQQLLSDIEFAAPGISQTADTVCAMVAAGILKTVSVGFQPIEWKASKTRPGGVDFTRQELLEVSIVPIPANANAVIQAKAFGAAADRLHLSRSKGPDFMTKRSAVAAVDDGTERRRQEARAIRGEHGRPGAFNGLSDFLLTVARAANDIPDTRLVRAPTGMSEVDPTGGGFAVPTEFTTALIESLYQQAVLAPLTDRRQTTRPDVRVPAIDETSRADGSRYGGTTSFWIGEGTTVPSSMPKYRSLAFGPKKLLSLCVVTNELLADAAMLEAHVQSAFAAEASFQLDRTIFSGTGAGVPLGILNSPALITIPKEGGQAAGTITASNIQTMWSRMPAPSRRRAVWLVNEDMESALDALTTAVGSGGAPASASSALYAGGGGPRLKGRPVLTIEQCPAIGQVGDIVLADLSQYILADRGSNSDLSLDVRFLTDESAFRFVMRIDGQPTWATPITPWNGTQTRSPYVALAART